MSYLVKITEAVTSFINKLSNKSLLGSLLGITFLTYIGVLFGHQFLTYDDNWYIYENKNVINFSWKSIVNMFTTLEGGQYSPLAELYHAVLYAVFGKSATAFKFFALLTHCINVALVFKLFQKLFSNRWLVIFVTLIFAIHPMQVEVVAWASAIFRIAVLFMLLGAHFYLKYLENFKLKYMALVLGCYILALFTKEQAVLFPLALILINISKKRYLLSKRIVVENIILGTIAITFGLITLQIAKTGHDIVQWNLPFIKKLYVFCSSVWGYLIHFLFPFRLSFSYPLSGLLGEVEGLKILKIIGVFPLLLLSIYGCMKSKKMLFGILWSVGFLSIALSFSFFSVREMYMSDRYAYIAIIGFAYTLFYLIKTIGNKFPKSVLFLHFSMAVYVLVLIVLSFNRTHIFKHSYTVWAQALEIDDKNYLAHNSMGYFWRQNGNLDNALVSYKRALELKPNYFLAHSNIGKVYFTQKKYDLALQHVSQAIKLNPNYKRAYLNRIAVNNELNNLQNVLNDLSYLIDLEPNNILYIDNRGQTYFKLKQYDKAIEDGKRILQIAPDYHFAAYLVGHNYLLLKNYKEAEKYLTLAINKNNKAGSYYYFRSVARLYLNKKQALADALKAKELGYKVPENYLKTLVKLSK